MKKIAFHTFGCKLNFSETSSIAKNFHPEDYTLVDFKEEADIYVINSCTVTRNAEKKCRTIIKQTHKRNPFAKIAVIGCYSQLKANELANLNGVKLILGNHAKFNLASYLSELSLMENENILIKIDDINKNNNFYPSFSFGDRTRSFLKIQDGCDYFCAYCTIPFARGRSRSDSIQNTINKAKEIAKTEVKEIILTGVNVGDFGKNNKENLFDLLKELNKIDGIERIRISSIEPDLLTDEIIELVASSKKLLPHFHIPLQSGSNDILKTMKRKYNIDLFSARINKIKSLIPDSMIAVDVIVGFPGETDKNFTDTYEYIKNSFISYAHVFPYSERKGTLTEKMNQKIPDILIKKRSCMLQKLSAQKKQKFYLEQKGKIHNVLFESENNNGYIYGFTENYIRVKTVFNDALKNQIVSVLLKTIDKDGIFKISSKQI